MSAVTRLFRCAVAVAAFAMIAPSGVGAQAADPVARLLQSARTAFDDLEYTRAINICRLALQQPTISRTQRVELLQVLAAAQFPNDPDAARPDSAATTLRTMVKLDLDAAMPRGLGWRGIDSLLTVVKSRVLSIAVAPGAEQQVRGADGAWLVPFRSTIEATFTLTAERNGVSVPLAETTAREGALSVPALKNRAPVLANGDWQLVVRARARADSEVVRLNAAVTSDSAQWVPLPAFDSTALRPESAKPLGGRAWLMGGLLGGATAAFATVFRAEDPVRSAYGTDARAYGVAAALAVGAGFAAFLDHGRALPENARANAALRTEHERLVAEATAENDRRLAALTTTVRITR